MLLNNIIVASLKVISQSRSIYLKLTYMKSEDCILDSLCNNFIARSIIFFVQLNKMMFLSSSHDDDKNNQFWTLPASKTTKVIFIIKVAKCAMRAKKVQSWDDFFRRNKNRNLKRFAVSAKYWSLRLSCNHIGHYFIIICCSLCRFYRFGFWK